MDVQAALLAYLRTQDRSEEARFLIPPESLGEGAESRIYQFQLAGGRPMVLRLLDGESDAERLQLEASLQNALAELGYPVPEVFYCGGSGEALGAPFTIMERLEGRTLFDWLPWALGFLVLCGVLGAPLLGLAPIVAMWTASSRVLRRLHDIPVPPLRARVARPQRLEFASRLEQLEESVDADARLSGLKPGLGWLRGHAPPPGASRILCHGDFWPGNVMVRAFRLTGVIDWGQAAIAPREYDLGWTRVQPYSRLPLPAALPDSAVELIWLLAQPFAWVFFHGHLWAYRLQRRIDRERLDYYGAFHCLRILAWAAQHPNNARGRWDAPRTQRQICRRFERLTGVAVAAPRRPGDPLEF